MYRFIFIMFMTSAYFGGGVSWAEHSATTQDSKATKRHSAPIANPNYAAISWVAFDNRTDFQAAVPLLRKLFCTRYPDDDTPNYECAVPVGPDLFKSLDKSSTLENFLTEAQALSDKLAQNGSPYPTLYVSINTHGLKDVMCRQGNSDISHQKLAQGLFAVQERFKKRNGRNLTLKISYAACYAASLVDHLRQESSDPFGAFTDGVNRYRYKWDLLAAGPDSAVSYGHELFDSLDNFAAKRNGKSDLLGVVSTFPTHDEFPELTDWDTFDYSGKNLDRLLYRAIEPYSSYKDLAPIFWRQLNDKAPNPESYGAKLAMRNRFAGLFRNALRLPMSEEGFETFKNFYERVIGDREIPYAKSTALYFITENTSDGIGRFVAPEVRLKLIDYLGRQFWQGRGGADDLYLQCVKWYYKSQPKINRSEELEKSIQINLKFFEQQKGQEEERKKLLTDIRKLM